MNQLLIIGFLGKDAETKTLNNGSTVTKFSVATKKSWKDDNDEWQEKSQWHNVVAWGDNYAQLGARLVKGTHVVVQGELQTRDYERTVKVPNGKKPIDYVVKQRSVELRADIIRILDRSQANGKPTDEADTPEEEAQ